MEGASIAILVPLGFFGMMSFIIWTVMNNRRRQDHLKTVSEFNSRLLDRIGSLKDFSDFLQTDGGVTFMSSLTAERGSIGPRSGVLRATQAGIVLVMVSLGCLFLAWNFAPDSVNHKVFMSIGVIVLSLGLGFVLSAVASYRLASRLGVLDRDDVKLMAQ